MKILLDHNLDRRLKDHLHQYDCSTTQQQGWADLINGELLASAEADRFDVLITADANIKNQQNVTRHRIAILVLRAFNNRLQTHLDMLSDIVAAFDVLKPGEVIEVFHRDIQDRQD